MRARATISRLAPLDGKVAPTDPVRIENATRTVRIENGADLLASRTARIARHPERALARGGQRLYARQSQWSLA